MGAAASYIKRNMVILTGAGISAESGLMTFRDNDGLWCNHRIEDVATPEAFHRNPKLVHEFYNTRRRQLREVQPNAAHRAIAELAEQWQGNLLLVTQNVDDLHERSLAGRVLSAGFNFVHMHGELKKIRCELCDEICECDTDIDTGTSCATCRRAGYVRPHIVWFGEIPMEMELIYASLRRCDLFISIGTSGNVYPAAGFVHEAVANGKAQAVELNFEPSLGQSLFHEKRYGKATEIVPAYVDELLGKY